MTPQEEIEELKKAISFTKSYIQPHNAFYDLSLRSIARYEAKIAELEKKIKDDNN